MYEGFIIYPTYRIENDKSYIYLIGRLSNGKSFCTKNIYKPYFFIKESDYKNLGRELNIESTNHKNFKNEKLVKIICDIPKEVSELRKELEDEGFECYEADIRFAYRYMIDKGLKSSIKIKGETSKNKEVKVDYFFEEPILENSDKRYVSKDITVLSFDIETNSKGDLLCISLASNKGYKNVLIKDKYGLKNAEGVKSEEDLLIRFLKLVEEQDPDVLTGWNVIDFDLKVLKEKIDKKSLKFRFGRFFEDCSITIFDSFFTDSKADFKGRLVLDGIHLLKSNFVSLEDYKLGTAAKEYLGESKLFEDHNKMEEIDRTYEEDPQKLADYNLKDSELVLDILDKSGTLDLTMLRSVLTGMPLDRVKASIASLDSLYLGDLRKRGFVAPSSKYLPRDKKTTGGYVMSSKPGIYDNIGVFDFKSLYPSLMVTFNIDPLTHKPTCEGKDLIKAPNDTCFSKEKGILPVILKNLMKEREVATKKKDFLTRQAIKILMNSMYGVMASPNCRFYNYDLANAITSFGHMMIKNTAKIAEKKGYKAIYGDTDSVFIDFEEANTVKAKKACEDFENELNDYFTKKLRDDYGVESYLVLEFEKLFKKMLIPKTRSGEAGAKKRYAGLLENDKIEFTGLEFVRRDWTEVSKKFQMELLKKVFNEEKIDRFIKDFITSIRKGEYDDLLVYKKAIRKNLSEYTKTTPPHVKAARKLDKLESNIISYYITKNGPEPTEKISSEIDYDHYVDKQIKPIAESILYLYNMTFEDLKKSKQTDLSGF